MIAKGKVEAQTVRKFKWFWAWQDDKEEAWLSEMAQAGWHLKWPAMPGFYTFEAGAPRQDVYRLDYVFSNKDYQNYLQLFQDAGWQHLGDLCQRLAAGRVIRNQLFTVGVGVLAVMAGAGAEVEFLDLEFF